VLRCHVAAFEAMGGVPSEVLYDRMRTAAGEDAEGNVVFNKSLLELGWHYGFLPKACRPYRAKTKGKVERPFRCIREDFFLARSFRDLHDLNAQFRQWLDQVANVPTHATTQRVCQSAWKRNLGSASNRDPSLLTGAPRNCHKITASFLRFRGGSYWVPGW